MSYSHSVSSGSSYSTPSSLQTPQSQLALALAQLSSQMGEYTFNWAQQAYAGDTAMTQEAVQNYLQMSQQGLGLANENLSDYNNIYRPEMAQLANEAGSYSSAARQQVNEGAAEAQSEQGAQAGLSAAQQQLQSYGINPNSGMYAELAESNRAAAGAAAAGAGQEAGLATQATGRQLLQASLQQGDQLPAAAVNALNSAYEGVAGAENSELANTNTGANAFDAANPFLSTAMSLRYPPVGNTSKSSQSGVSNATPAQKQQPGYKGGAGQQGGAGGGGGNGPSWGTGTTPVSENGTGGGGGGAGGKGGGGGSIADIQQLNPNQNSQQGNYGNPVLPAGTDSTNIGGNYSDPYSAYAGMEDLNQSAIPNYDFGGLDTGTGTVGAGPGTMNTAAPVQNLNTPFSPGPAQPAQPTGGIDTGGGFGGGASTGIPGMVPGGGTTSMLDQFNPVSSANADAFSDANGGVGTPDTVPNQDATGGGGGGGGNYTPQPEEETGATGDNGGDQGGAGGYGGGGYARGGQVGIPMRFRNSPAVSRRIPPNRMGGFHSNAPSLHTGATTGGFVPKSDSPSGGRQTDDVPARVNAGEFVMPRDVTHFWGHKKFQDMINQARKAIAMHGGSSANPPAKPQMKPMSQQQQQNPRFVSRPVGR